MRSRFAFTLVLLYLIALCRPVSPLIEYYANQDFFAKVLCINKDKPEMHCNGQCVLMQRLKKAMQDEPVSPSAPLPKIEFRDYPIGFISTLFSSAPAVASKAITDNTFYQELCSSLHAGDFFHPPRIS